MLKIIYAALVAAALTLTAASAYAEGAAGGMPGGSFAQFIPLILIFVVFYFLLIRPQQRQAKKHQVYLNELKKGNKVITKGGILAEITGLTDSVLTLEIADSVKIRVTRDAIAGPQAGPESQKDSGAGAKNKKLGGG